MAKLFLRFLVFLSRYQWKESTRYINHFSKNKNIEKTKILYKKNNNR